MPYLSALGSETRYSNGVNAFVSHPRWAPSIITHTNIRCGVGGWSACRCNDALYVSLSQKDWAQRSWQGSNRPGPLRPTPIVCLLEGQFDESVLGLGFCEHAVKPAGAL